MKLHCFLIFSQVITEHLANTDEEVEERIFTFVVSALENTRVQNYFFNDLDIYTTFNRSLLSTLASRPIIDVNVSKKLLETIEVFAR